MQLSMFSAAERPVSHSPSPASEKDWLILAATSCSPILPSLTDFAPAGSSGRMCLASCQAMEDGTLVPSSGAWGNSGMGMPTECLTLNSAEHSHTLGPSRNDGGVCSLSDILETGDVPQRFFLTAKACQGILRRAEKRGKVLPQPLQRALAAVAGLGPTSTATEE